MNLEVPFILESFLTLVYKPQIRSVIDSLLLSELVLKLLQQSMLLLKLDL